MSAARFTREMIDRCPQCHSMTAELHGTTAVGKCRYCLHCDLTFMVRYNKSLHKWYRSNMREGMPDDKVE